MGRSLIETVMGAVVLVVAGMFVWFVHEQRTVDTGDGYEVLAKFDNVAGIAAGSEVRIGGLKVGTVTKAELDEKSYRPQLALHLRNDITLSSDTSAAIVSEGLLGSKYIELTPGGMDDNLKNGSEISITQSSVNLEQMIGKFMFSGGGVDDKGAEKKAETGAATSSFLDDEQ